MNRTDALHGILLAAGGVATLCAMDAVAKGLGAHISTFQVTFVRYLGACIWLAAYIAITRSTWPKRENAGRHALRGGLMVVTACFFFYGVTNLPLAVAAALAMTAPIYISLLSVVFLKEPMSRTLLGAIGLGIAGSLVIVLGGSSIQTGGASSILAWGAGILAPLTYAAALVLMKHHVTDEPAASMTLAQSGVAAFVALPLAVPGFTVPALEIWWQVVLIGFLGAVGFIFILSGLRRLPASVFAVVDYTALLWAAFYGYVFFTEVPEPALWIGGAAIISACALGMQAARKQAVPVSPEPSTPIPPDVHPSSVPERPSSSGS
jgi:drug/metabolite transporter (DMT)-like permease